jgi:dihydrofolate synthase/folylpolyglutamate synthase
MLANKDADGVLRHLTGTSGPCTVVAVPVPGHACQAPEHLAQIARRHGASATFTAPSLHAAFDVLASQDRGCSVLIAGSLYLAGEALSANDELPT